MSMKIVQQQVEMESKRTYESTYFQASYVKSTPLSLGQLDSFSRTLGKESEVFNPYDELKSGNAGGTASGSGKTSNSLNTGNVSKTERELEMDRRKKVKGMLLDYLIRLFLSKSSHGKKDLDAKVENYKNALLGQTGSGSGYNLVETGTIEYISEEENTSFSMEGKVVTADGRTLDFNIEVEMSRSFQSLSQVTTSTVAANFQDPLVINLDGDIAEMSDQKFYFDIDCDGIDDEISQLEGGSGFLAMDKNQDGIINDGSELFGGRTGDGFSELSAYDEDGNGWIDEGDKAFGELKIWEKQSDGSSKLCSLEHVGIGAIYLGKVGTEFSMTVDNTREVSGKVRSSGIFLYESGASGTVQQIDFAKS